MCQTDGGIANVFEYTSSKYEDRKGMEKHLRREDLFERNKRITATMTRTTVLLYDFVSFKVIELVIFRIEDGIFSNIPPGEREMIGRDISFRKVESGCWKHGRDEKRKREKERKIGGSRGYRKTIHR